MNEELKVTKENKQIADIVDGHDMNQDIHQLIGYVWGYGERKDNEVFPASHLSLLAEKFLDKHRKKEQQLAERDAEIQSLNKAIAIQRKAVNQIKIAESKELQALRKDREKYYAAINSIDSEKTMNAALTNELAKQDAEIERLKAEKKNLVAQLYLEQRKNEDVVGKFPKGSDISGDVFTQGDKGYYDAISQLKLAAKKSYIQGMIDEVSSTSYANEHELEEHYQSIGERKWNASPWSSIVEDIAKQAISGEGMTRVTHLVWYSSEEEPEEGKSILFLVGRWVYYGYYKDCYWSDSDNDCYPNAEEWAYLPDSI